MINTIRHDKSKKLVGFRAIMKRVINLVQLIVKKHASLHLLGATSHQQTVAFIT